MRADIEIAAKYSRKATSARNSGLIATPMRKATFMIGRRTTIGRDNLYQPAFSVAQAVLTSGVLSSFLR